jgi:hypothetical protein
MLKIVSNLFVLIFALVFVDWGTGPGGAILRATEIEQVP